MIKQETIQAYTIDQHPNKEAVYSWIRDNWHDLGEHEVNDFVDSLKALANEVGGTLDYSVSLFPDRGEYIKLDNYYVGVMNSLYGDCLPVTGFHWDKPIIEAAQEALHDAGMNSSDLSAALSELHKQGEYIYSDAGLYDLCDMNEYFFTEDGAFHS